MTPAIPVFDKKTNKKLAYLDNYIVKDSFVITRALNGETTANFQAIYKVFDAVEVPGIDIRSILTAPTYIQADGLLFDTAYIEQMHEHNMSFRVECEHVTYRLLKEEKKEHEHIGTAIQILEKLISGTEFTVGKVDFTETFIFKGKPDKDGNFVAGNEFTFPEMESDSALGQIRELANAIKAKLEYDGFSISLRNTLDTDRNFVARFGKNIEGITRYIDWRKDIIYYSIDIALLKKLSFSYEPYIILEEVEEGDLIRIIDDELDIDSRIRVVSREYDPIGQVNLSLEIANNIEMLADDIDSLRQSTNRLIKELSVVIIECVHISTSGLIVTVRITDSSITALPRHGTYQFNVAYPIPNNAIIRLVTPTNEMLASRPWLYQNNRAVRSIDFAVGARVQVMDSGASFFNYALLMDGDASKAKFQIAGAIKKLRKIAIIGNTVAFRGDL